MRKWLIIWNVLFCSLIGKADVRDIPFQHLSVLDGLSDDQVNCVLRDSRGYVWIGTNNGLNRYDGYHIKQYFQTDDTTSLLGNRIESMQEDANGYVWIHHYRSYMIYDPQKDCFMREAASLLKTYDIAYGQTGIVFTDKEKDLWVYNEKDLFKYQFATKQTIRIDLSMIDSTQISVITDDVCGSLYLVHSSGVIERLSKATGEMTGQWQTPVSLSENDQISSHYLFVDSQGNLWTYVSYGSGVFRYDIRRHEWTEFGRKAKKPAHRLSNDMVRAVAEDPSGNIWMALDHGGINVYSVLEDKITRLEYAENRKSSLASNAVISLSIDKDGTVWAGHMKDGLSYYNKQSQKFRDFQKELQYKTVDVNCFLEDSRHWYWMGSDSKGLLLKRPEDSTFHVIKEMAERSVITLFEDAKGRIWISSYRNGISCYAKGRFCHYTTSNSKLIENNIWSMEEDCNGYIWMGCLTGGIQRFNPDTRQFEKSVCKDKATIYMCSDHQNIIYAATVYGVVELNTETGKYDVIYGNKKGTQPFSNLAPGCMYCDSRGLLWMSGTYGLQVYDTKRDSVFYITQENGLLDNVVCAIKEDRNHTMWISTGRGLSNIKVLEEKEGAYSYKFNNYDAKDGLWVGHTSSWSIAELSDGSILLGGSRGCQMIKPTNAEQDKPTESLLKFTGLYIQGIEICSEKPYDGRVILKKSLAYTDRIELSYLDKMVDIEFSTFDVTATRKCEHFYRMEGLSSEWMPTKEHRLTFSHLPVGHYVLSVKDDQRVISLVVDVLPPLWLTPTAWCVYALLFGFLTWLLFYMLHRRHRERLRVQRIEMESERQRKVNDMKMQFFTNISHDFRTPLSLIISPLEKLMEDNPDKHIQPNLKLIYRSAMQMLTLVNQLLDFRKLEKYGSTLEISHGDIVGFMRNVCHDFDIYSERKNIRLTFSSNEEAFELAFDKDKMQKIMMNLLSNAYKFTEKGGSIGVDIKIETSMVTVNVADTGMGIKDEDKKHIFERFYQVVQPEVNYGTGIGLHIVYEFVALHGGYIKVTDNHPKGTVFTFTCPVRQEENACQNQQAEAQKEPDKEELEILPNEKQTLLVVEDNDDFREFLGNSLVENYNVLMACDGIEALNQMTEHNVDVVITDVMMPRMDGIKLCEHIKSDLNTSHIPVIMLTARTTDEQKLEGLQTGADEYIAKPFNLSILKLRIEKFIEWKRRSHEMFQKKVDVSPSSITITSLDEQFIAKAVEIVEKNMDDTEFSVETLSSGLAMSRGYLYKKLMFITGKSPIEFIRIIRLKRSKQYLEESQMNVSEIAYQVGFSNPKKYTKYFRDEFGMTPSEYRKNVND